MARRGSPVGILVGVLLILPAASALAPAPGGIVEYAKHYMQPFTGKVLPSAGPLANDLLYHGGAIEKAPKVYLVFWGWGSLANPVPADPAGEAPVLISFFQGVGGSSWANIDAQYSSTAQGLVTNPTGQLGGVWWDNSTALSATTPAEPVDQAGVNTIGQEALNAAKHFGYSADADYFVVMPHLHNDPEFMTIYCAWHSAIGDGFGHTVSYTYLPYIPDADVGASAAGVSATVLNGCGDRFVNAGAAGALDGVTIVAGHEYSEAVTDPVPASGWVDSSGAEIGDKCAWVSSGPGRMQDITLSTGTFAVQGLWSNAAHGCAISYP